MTRQTFQLTYGQSSKSFSIPRASLANPQITPRNRKPLAGTVEQILARALAMPIGRERLSKLAFGRRVGIVISDEFRAGLQREILDALLEEIVQGQPQSMLVLCATGTHQPQVYAKNAAGWVAAAASRLGVNIDFEAHDSERSQFVDLGSTPLGTQLRLNAKLLACDLRVYGHESKHHYLNGYSCIDKQIVPGLAWGQTVAQNHKRALHPDSGPGRNPWHSDPRRRANPFAEDTRDARAISEGLLLDPGGQLLAADVQTFGLDMVSGGQNVYWVGAGDPEQLCRQMVQVVDDLMAFEVEPSRYVIISPGGPPASQALYGTQNCFDLGLKGAIEVGGQALVVAPLDGRADLPADVSGLAPDRRAKNLFWDNLVRLLPLDLAAARKEIDEQFELYLWKTDRVLRLFKDSRVSIWLHSQLPAAVIEPGGFHAAPDIQAWIDERLARNDGLFTVIDHGNKLYVSPKF